MFFLFFVSLKSSLVETGVEEVSEGRSFLLYPQLTKKNKTEQSKSSKIRLFILQTLVVLENRVVALIPFKPKTNTKENSKKVYIKIVLFTMRN